MYFSNGIVNVFEVIIMETFKLFARFGSLLLPLRNFKLETVLNQMKEMTAAILGYLTELPEYIEVTEDYTGKYMHLKLKNTVFQ